MIRFDVFNLNLHRFPHHNFSFLPSHSKPIVSIIYEVRMERIAVFSPLWSDGKETRDVVVMIQMKHAPRFHSTEQCVEPFTSNCRIGGGRDGWMEGSRVRVRPPVRPSTVINDLRPPSAGSHGNHEPLSRSLPPGRPVPSRPPSFGLCSRASGPVSLSLPCDQIGPPPSRLSPLPFLPFRLHPDLPRLRSQNRSSLLSSLPLAPSAIGGLIRLGRRRRGWGL